MCHIYSSRVADSIKPICHLLIQYAVRDIYQWEKLLDEMNAIMSLHRVLPTLCTTHNLFLKIGFIIKYNKDIITSDIFYSAPAPSADPSHLGRVPERGSVLADGGSDALPADLASSARLWTLLRRCQVKIKVQFKAFYR